MTPATPSQAAAAVVQQADTIATAQAEAIRRAWHYNMRDKPSKNDDNKRLVAQQAEWMRRWFRVSEWPPAEDPADTRMADAFREPED